MFPLMQWFQVFLTISDGGDQHYITLHPGNNWWRLVSQPRPPAFWDWSLIFQWVKAWSHRLPCKSQQLVVVAAFHLVLDFFQINLKNTWEKNPGIHFNTDQNRSGIIHTTKKKKKHRKEHLYLTAGNCQLFNMKTTSWWTSATQWLSHTLHLVSLIHHPEPTRWCGEP